MGRNGIALALAGVALVLVLGTAAVVGTGILERNPEATGIDSIGDFPVPDGTSPVEHGPGPEPGHADPPGASAPSGREFHVSTDGSDQNDGTPERPWRTIQKAADMAAPGDTVLVREGLYREMVSMKVSGTPEAPITFRNHPGEVPVIDGSGLEVDGSGRSGSLLHIEDKSHIRIVGFVVSNLVSTDASVPAGIRILGACRDIQIRDTTVTGIRTTYDGSRNRNAHGIAAYGTDGDAPLDGLVIDNCQVYGCVLGQSESVVLNGNVTNFQVTNNRIHDNDNIGIDFIGWEGTAKENDQARQGICAGNEVWNISSRDNGTYGGDLSAVGIYVDGGTNILIERNRVWNADIGIECASEHQGRATSHITVRNNLVRDCRGYAGISIGGSERENGSAEHIRIHNNTLYNNRTNLVFQHNCQTSTNVVRNNILYRYGDDNLYGDRTDILLSHNITGDPGFISEGSDFRLGADSVAVDAGTSDVDVGETDLDGNPRIAGKAVDCGCYERQ
ncbi:right-handed parallel beta-helix repeat-containing protein [Anaerotalea alkaliphila]|uniref:DUF5123 domain-containing protein n=1 Tax=Anaerotalea alkaliphila TaxID=2662126 RepID=A0A7X5KMD7_9FIRM|nr:right-handed parallel beta-helix repeat-containing protein [Anaerotalea alkaliphila]NDL67861.1 DUF5123 domain-containing protein [Anaerotalea alkaliphila]